MKSLSSFLAAAIIVATGGCAMPSSPLATISGTREVPVGQDLREAVEAARRAERLRLLNRNWHEQTLDERDAHGGEHAPPTVEYPSGVYAGIRFGPRSAPNPELTEPVR